MIFVVSVFSHVAIPIQCHFYDFIVFAMKANLRKLEEPRMLKRAYTHCFGALFFFVLSFLALRLSYLAPKLTLGFAFNSRPLDKRRYISTGNRPQMYVYENVSQ